MKTFREYVDELEWTNRITESFDTKPSSFKISHSDSMKTVYEFTSKNVQYEVHFVDWKGQGKDFVVSFQVKGINDDDKVYLQTNKGDQFRVLVSVIYTIKNFIENHPDFEKIGFSAEKEEQGSETSRASVYQRLIQKFLPHDKYKIKIMTTDVSTGFVISHKTAFDKTLGRFFKK